MPEIGFIGKTSDSKVLFLPGLHPWQGLGGNSGRWQEFGDMKNRAHCEVARPVFMVHVWVADRRSVLSLKPWDSH